MRDVLLFFLFRLIIDDDVRAGIAVDISGVTAVASISIAIVSRDTRVTRAITITTAMVVVILFGSLLTGCCAVGLGG